MFTRLLLLTFHVLKGIVRVIEGKNCTENDPEEKENYYELSELTVK